MLTVKLEKGKEGDSKLLDHISNFRRNSTIRLRCFNGNSVIDENLKWAWTSGNNMFITLTFIVLNCGTNFEKSFLVFLLLLLSDLSSTSLTMGITQGILLFEFWLEKFMIRNRLSILVMISSSVC